MNPVSLTVLYDGGCPLCGREISHYRKLAALRTIEWVDVTSNAERLAQFGVIAEDAMAEFHVFDESGQLHKGADGFVVLWQALPYYRWLAKLCLWLRLLPLMRWGYGYFAQWHFRRRCVTEICRVKNQDEGGKTPP